MEDQLGFFPIQSGETRDGEMERPLSAPPPPGFVDGPAEQRGTWILNELLASDEGIRAVSKSKGGNISDYTSETSIAHTFDSSGRNTSFSNMAAYLGTGLVESMEDAMQESASNHLNTTTEVDPSLGIRRMARHTASRMMGLNESSSVPIFPPNERTGILYARPPPEQQPAHGFPTSLSSPPRKDNASPENRKEVENKELVVGRSTTPVNIFPVQQQPQQPDQFHGLPKTIDIGTKVMEPEEESHLDFASQTSHFELQSHGTALEQIDATIGSDSNRSLKELERGMKNMWVPEAREFKPATMGPPSQASSISEPVTELSPRQAENDLRPFLWDGTSQKPSRTLAILRGTFLRAVDLRAACERYGVLEGFRADFSSRGIFFVSYLDIRSAQYAAKELQPILQRMSVMQGGSEEIIVNYCLSMSASSQSDESRIVFSGLPYDVNEYSLNDMLSSFGSLRSLMKDRKGDYIAEFHNLQDSKQALLEIESSQLLGPQVQVNVSIRDTFERKKGKELLAMLGRWRQGMSRQGSVTSKLSANGGGYSGPVIPTQPDTNHWLPEAVNPNVVGGEPAKRQFVLGPDGLYTEVVVTAGNFPSHMGHPVAHTNPKPQQQQQIIQGADGQFYVTTGTPQMHVQMRGGNHGRQQQHSSQYPPSVISTGSYGDHRPSSYYGKSSESTSVSGRSYRSGHSAHSNYSSATTEERDNRHLTLDLTAVEEGRDTRTSLMVRNIPNKYTQHMLLSEFEENGHGPGVIDFFYLPIDFKNRCNRGYAFINFVRFQDILQFHQRYYGKHWRTFNSDKICDITYARIQGKDAMLKRFENSALMEKDDEYKPLVFMSEGPQKGQRITFPDPNRGNRGRVEV